MMLINLKKFNSNIVKHNINKGQLDVLCILESKEDYDKFIKVLDFLNYNYKSSKLYIFLNSSYIKQIFKESILKKYNFSYYLIKTSENEDVEDFKINFNILSNGSYKINLVNINLEKDILDLINEDCINTANI